MAATFASIDFYTDDSATPMTTNKPASTVAGDVLVMIIGIDSGALTDLTAPAGWATPTGGTVDIAGQRCKVWAKTAGGAEPSTYDFGYNSGAACAGAMLRVTGADGSNVKAASASSGSNGATMDSPTITPTGSDDLLICSLITSGGTAPFLETDPSGMTDRGQIQLLALYEGLAVATLPLASSSATGAKTWTGITPTGRQCGTFSVTVASAAASYVRPTIINASTFAVQRAGSW